MSSKFVYNALSTSHTLDHHYPSSHSVGVAMRCAIQWWAILTIYTLSVKCIMYLHICHGLFEN